MKDKSYAEKIIETVKIGEMIFEKRRELNTGDLRIVGYEPDSGGNILFLEMDSSLLPNKYVDFVWNLISKAKFVTA